MRKPTLNEWMAHAMRKPTLDEWMAHTVTRYAEIQRAKNIGKSLGVWVAARYMYKRGWSIEAARYVLLGV